MLPAVVVVGASGAIGRELVRAFLRLRTWAVIAVGRSETGLQELRDEAAGNPRLSLEATDITSEAETAELFAHCCEELNARALVYCAGRVPDAEVPLRDYGLDAWEETFAVYSTGFFLAARECLRRFPVESHILLLSSAVTRFATGDLPPLHMGHYAAAKAASDELCKWLRREGHERGILVSRLAPAAVETDFHVKAPAWRRPPAMVPMKRVADRVLLAIVEQVELDEVMLPAAELWRGDGNFGPK